MFWNKKEDKDKLPDLPPFKQSVIPSPIEENEMKEKHALPSFPDSPHQSGFSQAAIKDAVNNEEDSSPIPEENTFPDSNQKFKTVEMEEWSPPVEEANVEEIIEKPKPQKAESFTPSMPPSSSQMLPTQDIFVKIDKFRTVRRTLYETKDKLEEIDSLLKRIRETKMREEQELSLWEKEISSVKAHIQEITSTIFEKVE